MTIHRKFWDGTRWDAHSAFNTVHHSHVSCYAHSDGFDSCDIAVVECEDGRWYIEDSWGDTSGAAGVWCPFSPEDAEPTFYQSRQDAIRRAVAVVAAVSGHSEEALLGEYIHDEDAL